MARRLSPPSSALIAIVLLLAGTAAAGQSMGPLDAHLLRGPDPEGPWRGAVEGDAYVLTNEQDPGAVKYVYAAPEAGGDVAVDVDVKAPAGAASGAGLLFGLDPQQGTYLAFVLQADGTAALYERGPDGLQRIAATALDAVRPKGMNRLGLVSRPDGAELQVNGQAALTLDGGGPITGGIGIIALGTGRFAFARFGQAAAPPGGTVPQPGALSSLAVPLPPGTGSCGDPGVDMLVAASSGVPVVPLDQLLPRPDWQLFMHPARPILAFYHPPGWQAMPLGQGAAVGVRLVAGDGSGELDILAAPPAGLATPRRLAEQALTGLLGPGGRTLCVHEFDVPNPFYPKASAFMAAATDRGVAAVLASVTFEAATGAPVWTDSRAVAGARAVFPDLVRAVFLPVFAQLQGGGGGGGDDEGGEEGGDDGGDPGGSDLDDGGGLEAGGEGDDG